MVVTTDLPNPGPQPPEGGHLDRLEGRIKQLLANEAGQEKVSVFAGDDWPKTTYGAPRYRSAPTLEKKNRELGDWAIDFVGTAGLLLDPWQDDYFRESLQRRPDEKWNALECGLCVSRQNGKGSILEARELVGLYADDRKYPGVSSRLAVHTAHEAKTAHEGFERLSVLIEQTPKLRARLQGKPRQSEGGEVIRLLGGRRIRFRTRTSGGGRGLSGDLLIFDEAMILMQGVHEAVWPIVTARENPQIWYTGSAVDKREPLMDEHGIVFARVRKRGRAGDPDLLYWEFSLGDPDGKDYENPDEVPPEVARDPESWAKTNPGLDVRLSRRIISVEQRTLSSRGFARERLGVGDWPDPDSSNRVIDEEKWKAACVDDTSLMEDPVVFAVDVDPHRTRGAIGVAGKNTSGKNQIEVVKRFRNVSGIIPTLEELVKRHGRRTEIVVNGVGSAASLIPEMERLKLNIVPVTIGEQARGCGMFFDGIMGDDELKIEPSLQHLGDPALNAAVAGSAKREVGDRWIWDRKDSTVDISPLVTTTLALYGFLRKRHGSAMVYGGADLLEEEENKVFDPDDLPPLYEEDLE